MRIILALLISCMVPTVQAQTVEPFAFGGVQHLTITKADPNPRFIKWGSKLGVGAHIRWAYVREPESDPRRRNCRSLVPLTELLKLSRISDAEFHAELVAATRYWSDIADITFEHVEDVSRADVLIGAQAEPLAYAFADVRARRSPHGDADEIEQAAICFNPKKIWRLRDGDASVFSLRRTLSHELGHAIGLDHLEWARPEGVMSLQFIRDIILPNSDERLAALRLYGPPRNKTPSG